MKQVCQILLIHCLVWLAASCGGGGSGPAESPWPPESPRQPLRLEIGYPATADPARWWTLNIHDQLPAGIYSTPQYRELAGAIIEQTNIARLENGLTEVNELEELNRVSQAHAFDQATRDYWSHTTPEGLVSRQRIAAATGYVVTAGGENSSIGLTGAETAAGIVRGWLTHTGHRELLLNPEVRYIGIGVHRYSDAEPVHFTQLLVGLDPSPVT